MSISGLGSIFAFLGGLGMFLYGMNLMSDGMQKMAGGKLQALIRHLTSNRLLGILMGAAITAIIQSSGATTVMVVGFVNAGMMNLEQAAGVIMGANIGTTITAWIVSLSQIGDAIKLLNPIFYAPLFIGIGALFMLFSKSLKSKTKGQIIIGVGLLFAGLDGMSGSIKPYTEAPIFRTIFEVFGKNPLLGILAGIIVTIALQSSSASVGILQTLAMNGVVNRSSAIYIILGEKIGSCSTAMISAAGANKTAKKAAGIHLMFNVIACAFAGVVFFLIFHLKPSLGIKNISSVQISIFHTAFSIAATVIIGPFSSKLVKISDYIVDKLFGSDDEDEEEVEARSSAETIRRLLDDRFLATPAVAIENVVEGASLMGNVVLKNGIRAMEIVTDEKMNEKKLEKVYAREKNINKFETFLTDYLVKISNQSLTEKQNIIVNHLFYAISDIERVGDHIENIAEAGQMLNEHQVALSQLAKDELADMNKKVLDGFRYSISALENADLECCSKAKEIEKEVDDMEKRLRDEHIDRLSSGKCKTEAGVLFIDIVSNLERMSDHSDNIADYVKEENKR